MKPYTFTTYCLTPVHDRDQMIRSVKYFHPDAPMEVAGQGQYDEWVKQEPRFRDNAYGIYACNGKRLAKDYQRVIHLDCDIIVVDKLDRLIDGVFSVAAPRNNNDWGLSNRSKPLTIGDVKAHEYVNAGTHAVADASFWDKWLAVGAEHGYSLPYGEQGALNLAMHGMPDACILDPVGSGEYWGLANSWDAGAGPWSSWKKIRLDQEGHLVLNGNIVKILHFAGGGVPGKDNKFYASLFSPEVWARIMEITK